MFEMKAHDATTTAGSALRLESHLRLDEVQYNPCIHLHLSSITERRTGCSCLSSSHDTRNLGKDSHSHHPSTRSITQHCKQADSESMPSAAPP